MSDYIFPEFIAKALAKPSIKVQMESSLVGITVMMLGSLGLVSYLIINGIVSGFWYILLIVSSELGVLSFQSSLLVATYQNYRAYKLANNMYPKQYLLEIKVEEAKEVMKELNTIIDEDKLNKSKEVKQC